MNVNYTNLFDFRPIPAITPASSYWENGTWKFNMSEISAGATYQPSWIDIILHGNTALTLVNAKADGLNYLKLFGGTEQLPEQYLDTVVLSGGCEQRNLPSEFTQVEYIESTGTQYIDMGTTVSSTDTFNMKVNWTQVEQYALFSSKEYTGWKDGRYLGITYTSTDSKTWYSRGQTITSTTTTTSFTVSADTDYTIKMEPSLNKCTVNGTLYNGQGNSQTTNVFTTANNPYLFANNNAGSPSLNDYVKVYYFQVVKSDGTYRLNLIPCRRNSDNVLGMYDTVSGTFLTNAGTGTFTAGADVTTPSPDYPMDIVSNNGVIKVNLNLYSTEYYDSTLSRVDGVTVTTNAGTRGVNVSSMIDCRTIKSFMVTAENTTGSYRLYKYNSSKSFINADATSNIGDVLTLDSTVGYFRIQYNYASINTQNILIYNSAYSLNGIYTDGTQEVVTDSVGNTANAEMLCAVGDYKDTQEVIAGSVTRNIGIKVLDGTEGWSVHSSGAMGLTIPHIQGDNNLFGYCSHFLGVQSGIPVGNLQIGQFKMTSTSNNIYFKTSYNNTTDWINYLKDQYNAGTPVIIVYPTNSATTETVTQQFLSKSPVTQTAGSISNLPIAITESSHTVPTPQQPLQINCNNGVLKVSRNLFDYRYFYDNYMVPPTSTVGRVAIKLLPNTNYTVSTNTQQSSTAAQVWTDTGSNPSAFSPVTSTNGVLIDTPRTVQSDSNGYIILAIRVGTEYEIKESDFESGNVWVQIEQGSTVTPYTPYSPNGIYTDGTVETVEITGKNLFNPNQEFELGYIDDNGNLVTISSLKTTTGYIKVSPSTTYNISYIAEQFSISNFNISLWTDDDIFISRVVRHNIQNLGVYSANFTTTSTTAKIKVTIWSDDTIYKDFQLEQGSTATTYEPYFNGGSATAEMLLKVGDYKDVQEVLTGNVTRNIGIKVLDGTEDWTRGTAIYANIPDLDAYLGYKDCYCTHFLGVNNSQQGAGLANSNKVCVGDQSNQSQYRNSVYIYGTTTDFPDVTTWTNYLKDQYNAGTPVIVVYPLATPTTKTVTAQPLTIQEGTNIVEITQASMDNLELEVSYKAGVAVTITEVENAQLDNNVEVTING